MWFLIVLILIQENWMFVNILKKIYYFLIDLFLIQENISSRVPFATLKLLANSKQFPNIKYHQT